MVRHSMALLSALMLMGCSAGAEAPKRETVQHLIDRVEETATRCIEQNDERACHDDSAMKELWRRGYCSKDAGGVIARCSKQEIIDDIRFAQEVH
jgi:hypothetical protein